MNQTRLPKLLRQEYAENQLNRRIVRAVYLKQDRTFIESCFERTEVGTYRLKPNLNDADLKRAVALAKQIRKNRGSLKQGRLIFVTLLITAVVLFNLLFKNVLLTRVGEQALQNTFEAKADIRDLDVALLAGRLSFSAITVADRDREYRNLFEIGPTDVDIDMIEALKGNVIIRRATIENIGWNTQRQDSGALAGSGRRPRPEATDSASSPFTDISLPSLNPEDARAFLMQHYNELTIHRVIDQAREALARLSAELPAQLDETRDKLSTLAASVTDLQKIEPQNLDTIEAAITAYRQVESTTAAVRQDTREIEQNLRALAARTTIVTESWDDLSDAAATDLAYLTNRISEITADPTGFVMEIVTELLRDTFAELFRYIDRAREITEITGIGPSSESAPPYRAGGVDIAFPSVRFPRFFLELTGVSFGTEQSGSLQEGFIRDLSTNPSIIGRPTLVDLRTVSARREHHIAAEFFLHRDDGVLWDGRYSGVNIPLSATASIATVDVHELAGDAAITTNVQSDRQGELLGTARIFIDDPILVITTGVSVVDEIIDTAVEQAGAIMAELEYTARDNRITSLRGSTNLDSHIADGVRTYITDQRAAFEMRLREQIADLVTTGRAELEPAEQQVAEIRRQIDDEIERSGGYRRTAEQKLTEVDARLAGLRSSADQRVQDEVDRARAEAERRAREEADRARDSILDRAIPRLR